MFNLKFNLKINPIKVVQHSLWSVLGCVSCSVSMWNQYRPQTDVSHSMPCQSVQTTNWSVPLSAMPISTDHKLMCPTQCHANQYRPQTDVSHSMPRQSVQTTNCLSHSMPRQSLLILSYLYNGVSEAKMKNNGYKISPCFWQFYVGNASKFYLYGLNYSIHLNSLMILTSFEYKFQWQCTLITLYFDTRIQRRLEHQEVDRRKDGSNSSKTAETTVF
jgi:hypothetical protein